MLLCVAYKDTQKNSGVLPVLSIWHPGHPEICHSCDWKKVFQYSLCAFAIAWESFVVMGLWHPLEIVLCY